MTSLEHAINSEALLEALAQQQHPLPEELQQSLQRTAGQLTNAQPNAATRLRELIEQYPPLEQAYLTVLNTLDIQEQAQGRTKGLDLTLDEFYKQSSENILIKILQEPGDIRLFARKVIISIKEKSISTTQEIAVLKAIEKRPLAPRELSYAVSFPILITQSIVQHLWDKGEIDRTTGNLLYSIFPALRGKNYRNQELNSKTYLTLTVKGYFRLYPLITSSQKGKWER